MDQLAQRLDRIYSALDEVRETDLTTFEVAPLEWKGQNTLGVDFRGGLSDQQLSNLAYSAIHNVAHLEGHLIRWARSRGVTSDLVPSGIAKVKALQVVIDLSNNDKHGYPPRDGGRSGLAPQLGEVERFMQMSVGSSVGVRFGPAGTARFEGSGLVVISGKVVDRAGNVIGELHELLHEAVRTWEAVLEELERNPETDRG